MSNNQHLIKDFGKTKIYRASNSLINMFDVKFHHHRFQLKVDQPAESSIAQSLSVISK